METARLETVIVALEHEAEERQIAAKAEAWNEGHLAALNYVAVCQRGEYAEVPLSPYRNGIAVAVSCLPGAPK